MAKEQTEVWTLKARFARGQKIMSQTKRCMWIKKIWQDNSCSVMIMEYIIDSNNTLRLFFEVKQLFFLPPKIRL